MHAARIWILILVLACSSAAGTTWYVDASATGANTGTSWTDAFPNFGNYFRANGDGGSNIVAGDLVWIKGGQYPAGLRVDRPGTTNAPIVFKTTNGLVQIQAIVGDSSANYITIDGSIDPTFESGVTNVLNLWAITNNIGLRLGGLVNVDQECVNLTSGALGFKLRWSDCKPSLTNGNAFAIAMHRDSGISLRGGEVAYCYVHDCGGIGVAVKSGGSGDSTELGAFQVHHSIIDAYGDAGVDCGGSVAIGNCIIGRATGVNGHPGQIRCADPTQVYNCLMYDTYAGDPVIYTSYQFPDCGRSYFYGNVIYNEAGWTASSGYGISLAVNEILDDPAVLPCTDPSLVFRFNWQDLGTGGAGAKVSDVTGNGHDLLFFGFPTTPTNWPVQVDQGVEHHRDNMTYSSKVAWFVSNPSETNNDGHPYGQFGAITNLNGLTNLTAMTISVWASYSPTNYDHQTLLAATDGKNGCTWRMGRRDHTSYQTDFVIWTNLDCNTTAPLWTNQITGYIGQGVSLTFPDNNDNSTNTPWHLYTATFNCTNQTMAIYLDGTNCGFYDFTGFCPSLTNLTVGDGCMSGGTYPGDHGWIALGCEPHNGSPSLADGDGFPNHGWMSGLIGDVRLYNRALTTGEVYSVFCGMPQTWTNIVMVNNTVIRANALDSPMAMFNRHGPPDLNLQTGAVIIADCTMKNNLMAGGTLGLRSSAQWAFYSTNTAQIDYNVCTNIAWDGVDYSPSAYGAEFPGFTHNKDGSPQFVNAAAYDFRLATNDTVAIASGTNLLWFVTNGCPGLDTDLTGAYRGNGAWDIGAFSAGAQAPPIIPGPTTNPTSLRTIRVLR